MSLESELEKLKLGKKTEYTGTYTPSLLQGVDRAAVRESIGLDPKALPFKGMDVWTAYELTWLNGKGRPEVAVMQLQVPISSPRMIESKSLKLYLGSFAETQFSSRADVQRTLDSDLMLAARAPVMVELMTQDQLYADGLGQLPGQSLDTLDIDMAHYQPKPDLLKTESDVNVRQAVFTHLLRSVCPVTGQPDHGSLFIQYAGPQIDLKGLLRYIVSFRNHRGFHEATVEQMFSDIRERCGPTSLTLTARYLRRGGIEITPHRSTSDETPPPIRLARQ